MIGETKPDPGEKIMSLGNADPEVVVMRRVLRHELEAIRGH